MILFSTLLRGYDPVKSVFVLEGLRNGFRLGLGTFGPFPPTRLWVESFVPVPESRGRITTYLTEEVALRRIFGPFQAVPDTFFWDRVNVSPMSEVLRGDGRYRTITNLSAGGPNNSINGFILDEATVVVYPTFLQVAQNFVTVGLDLAWVALFDVQAAYRNLRVHHLDWKYCIIAWRDLITLVRQYWLDVSLMFGGRAGCATYDAFGKALEWILCNMCFAPDAISFPELLCLIIRYLDDHLLFGRSEGNVNATLDRMLALMAKLNVPVKHPKTVRATTTIKFSGYWWDPRADCVSLDAERWLSIEAQLVELAALLSSLEASAQDLRCVSGTLVWASRVFPGSKVFIRGMQLALRRLGATSIPASAARLIIISDPSLVAEIHFDLSWWLQLCSQHRLMGDAKIGFPISLIVNPVVAIESLCSLVFYCDASRHGLGAFRKGDPGTLWAYAPLPSNITLRQRCADMDDDREMVSSGYAEAAGLLMGLLCFLPIWAVENPSRKPGVPVWVWTDSSSVVGMWASQRAAPALLPYLRAFTLLSSLYSIVISISHIPGYLNTTADSISRTKWQVFRSLQPHATQLPLVAPSEATLFL